MTFISISRELLQINLRTYGEEALAPRVPSLSDAEMHKIGEAAGRHATTGGVRLIDKALTLAAVEVLEGGSRPLKRSRRRLKGIYPGR
jgi:hypothetical protein